MLPVHWSYEHFKREGKDEEGRMLFRCLLLDEKQLQTPCNALLAFHNVGSLKQHLKLAKHAATWEKHTKTQSSTSTSTTTGSSCSAVGGRGQKRTVADMFRGAVASSPSACAAAAASGSVAQQAAAMELDDAQSITDTVTSASLSSPPPARATGAAAAATVWRRPAKQQRMSAYVDQPLDPLNCILMMLVMNCWPLSAIDNPYLRQAFSRTAKAGPSLQPLPTRNTLRKLVTAKHAAMKTELVKTIKELRAPVSFVLDGWTDVNHNKVTNVLLVARGQAFYWCSINNQTERNTAVWLAAALQPVIRGIEAYGIAVVSFVADNEEVMSKTHRLLKPEFGALLRIPCAAHTIQLIVKKIMLASPFKELIREYIEMLNLFSSNKQLRLALENAQPSSNTARRLIRPCDTRWSYTLVSIDRSIKLQHYIGAAQCMHQLTPKAAHFWQQLAEIAAILRPFAAATDVLQRDNSVLWDVADQFAMLVDHAVKIEATHPTIGTMIQRSIRAEWASQHVHTAATAACGFLARKPGHEKLITREDDIKAQKFIVEWGSKYLNHYQPFSFADGNIQDILDSQIVEFSSNSGTIFGAINFHKRLATLGPLAAWNSMLNGAPELAHVAVALVGVCASEAAVERSFSLQDRIHSKTRNRSGPDLVEAQMFIKFNSPLLHAEFLPTIGREDPAPELSCDSEDTQPNGIVLKYLQDAPPAPSIIDTNSVGPPPDFDAAAAAADVAEADIVSLAEAEAGVNDVVQDDDPLEEEAEAPALAVESIIATMEEENAFLRKFLKDNKIKPNAKGKVTIVGDLENKFSNEVEAHVPKIKTQLKVLKNRLVALSRT